MLFRLLSFLVGFAIMLIVTAAPAAAGSTHVASPSPVVSSVLTPSQSGASTPAHWGDCGCLSGVPAWGGSLWPWWAGMSLPAITAASGGTWPWAPWYWTPQWWTLAALSGR